MPSVALPFHPPALQALPYVHINQGLSLNLKQEAQLRDTQGLTLNLEPQTLSSFADLEEHAGPNPKP